MERPLVFYPRYAVDLVAKHLKLLRQIWRLGMFRQHLKRDPNARLYSDLALTPVVADEFEAYEMFSTTESAKSEATKMRKPAESRVPNQNLVNIGQ